MNATLKKAAAWAVIYVIALQTLMAAAACPNRAVSLPDPSAVICHSDASGSGPQTPQPDQPSDCCSHCVLCGDAPMADTARPVTAIEPFRAGLHAPLHWRPALRLAGHDRSATFARGPPEVM